MSPAFSNPKVLPKDFFTRDTITVARELLGCTLVRIEADGSRTAGIIVETEAYLGAEDPAAHSFGNRRTSRTNPMYLEGGSAYVYFIYGMHFCFNVVTCREDQPEAVLIRAIEPTNGIETIRSRRKVKRTQDTTNGPGKLCQALGIDKSLNEHLLTEPPLFIEGAQFKKSESVEHPEIEESSRIGVAYAGDAASWPLRFSIKGNLFVSGALTRRRSLPISTS